MLERGRHPSGCAGAGRRSWVPVTSSGRAARLRSFEQSPSHTRPRVLPREGDAPTGHSNPDARIESGYWSLYGMTEGRDEEAAAACFGTVTALLQRLFSRLPKGRSGSEKLQALWRFRQEAQLARGRSQPLQLGAFRGCLLPYHQPSSWGREPRRLLAAWYLMLSSAPALGPGSPRPQSSGAALQPGLSGTAA